MTQRLTNLEITRVSLVDKGANAKRLAVFKRDEEAPMPDATVDLASAPAGVIAWLRKQLGFAEPVAKGPQTFSEIVAGHELTDALHDNWYTLEDALWSALYATDDNMQPLSMEAKQALVAQNLDEFKAYLLDQMASVVSKSDAPPSAAARAQAAVTALVAKVGKKFSGSRLERLQSAAEALTSVLDEVAEAVTDEAATTAEEVQVDKAELVAAFTEANEPIVKRLEALEKTGVAKTEPDPGEDDALTLEGVASAVEKLADAVADMAMAQGVRKSLASQDGGTEPVKKSVFAGIM